MFEKPEGEDEFVLTGLFSAAGSTNRAEAIRAVREDCGWDLRGKRCPALFPDQERRDNPPAPSLGGEKRQVLHHLGYGDGQIRAFEAEGVVSITKRKGD